MDEQSYCGGARVVESWTLVDKSPVGVEVVTVHFVVVVVLVKCGKCGEDFGALRCVCAFNGCLLVC